MRTCKSVRMYFKFYTMIHDSQLIDAFSKGLEVKRKEVEMAERLLLRAATLLEDHDKIANIKYVSVALVDEIKQFLKIPVA